MRYAIITKPTLPDGIASTVVNLIEWDGVTPYDAGPDCLLIPAEHLAIDQKLE